MALIYPAIDLIAGKCVRLAAGDFARKTIYEADPIAMASAFARAGSTWIHVVDLDGAKAGRRLQSALIDLIQRETGAAVQTGGGIRNLADAAALLNGGVGRVVLGTLAMRDPEGTARLIERLGSERIVLALDIKLVDGVPRLASSGWTMTEQGDLWSATEFFLKRGLRHVLCTDVSKDGIMTGPNFDLYREMLARYPTIELQASGGVSSLDDLKRLKAIGVAGVVVGRALYEGAFSLEDAITC